MIAAAAAEGLDPAEPQAMAAMLADYGDATRGAVGSLLNTIA